MSTHDLTGAPLTDKHGLPLVMGGRYRDGRSSEYFYWTGSDFVDDDNLEANPVPGELRRVGTDLHFEYMEGVREHVQPPPCARQRWNALPNETRGRLLLSAGLATIALAVLVAYALLGVPS
jgi:hypothetical protein